MIRIYKCPSGGGVRQYQPGTDNMICPNCKNMQPISVVDQKTAGAHILRVIQQDRLIFLLYQRFPACLKL